MANLTEAAQFDGVYRLERTDLLDAGVAGAGPLNSAPQNLTNRTKYLKAALDLIALTPTATMADVRTALGIALGADAQPYDADLAAIAALTTTAYGRSVLTQADAAALRTLAGLVIGTDVQAYDSDLAAIAALTTTAYGRSVLTQADAAALRTLAGLVIGTDVQAYDSDLAAIAALATATFGRSLLTQASAAAARTTLGTLVNNAVCQGRATLTSGTPVTTSDVTAATNIYFTPYAGNLISLWNGTTWELYTFSELTLSLSGATANTNYDVFIYDNSGTLTLERVAWTNSTTRASAISRRNGVWVKTSDDRRLLFTFRTTSVIGQTEDSLTKRFVWNVQNRVSTTVRRYESTVSWSYGSATWRYLNNASANRIELVCGLDESPISLNYQVHLTAVGGIGCIAIGLDSNTTFTGQIGQVSGCNASATINFSRSLSIGYHYLAALESVPSGTTIVINGTDGSTTHAGLEGVIFR